MQLSGNESTLGIQRAERNPLWLEEAGQRQNMRLGGWPGGSLTSQGTTDCDKEPALASEGTREHKGALGRGETGSGLCFGRTTLCRAEGRWEKGG